MRRSETPVLARMIYYTTAWLAEMPDLSKGACVGSEHADDWHADLHRDAPERARARQVCMECPVLEACRSYALADTTVLGTWGGLTERERDIIRGRRTYRRQHRGLSA